MGIFGWIGEKVENAIDNAFGANNSSSSSSGSTAASTDNSSAQNSSSGESSANKGWQEPQDNNPSVIKVTNNESTYKAERLSQSEKPNSHEIYKVDKEAARSETIVYGDDAERGTLSDKWF